MTLEQILKTKLTDDRKAKDIEDNYSVLFDAGITGRNYGYEQYIKLNRLEKLMTPTVPEIEGDGYDDKGNICYDTGYCPNCHKDFEIDYEQPKHCPDCGQAIAWEEAFSE
jgi:hypothetical protein